MMPVLVKKIKFLDYPVDFNIKFNKKPILGKNKTFRGFFFGCLGAIIFTFLQSLLYPYFVNYSLINYSSYNFILIGFLLGFGALFGDSIKSFFKRRLNIHPGKSWIVFDQIDWILGSLLFTSFFIGFNYFMWMISIVLFGILHIIINYIGYILKIKKNKF